VWGPLRFNELERAVSVSSRRTLSTRLRELRAAGLVERVIDPGPPIKSIYHLTPKGEQLQPALLILHRWAAGDGATD